MNDVIAAEIAHRGRGAQTALAKAVGVEVQTVNKWVKGQTSPRQEMWEAIETALEISQGALADAAGFSRRDDAGNAMGEIRMAVGRIEVRQDEMARATTDIVRTLARIERRLKDRAAPRAALPARAEAVPTGPRTRTRRSSRRRSLAAEGSLAGR